MGHCDNFKTPTQLGLLICTADITCYNGANLSCVELPSSPNLNDVIAAIDASICNLTSVINDFTSSVVHPNEPWVSYVDTDAEITSVQYSGTSGNILNGVIEDIDINMKYNVIAPNALALKVRVSIPIDIDRTAIGYSTGSFNISFNFPVIPSVVDGWFNGSTKTLVASSINPICSILIDPPSSDQFQVGSAFAELSTSFGLNKVRIWGYPNGWTEDGNHTVTLTLDTVVEIA